MFIKIVQTFTLCSILTLGLYAKESQEQEQINHLSLATLMIYDAKYDKAEAELALVDKESQEFDAADFYTVLGVLYSKKAQTKKAIIAYKKAIEATKTKRFEAPKIVQKEKYLFSIGDSTKSSAPAFNAEQKREQKIAQLSMYLTQEYYKLKDYKNTLESLNAAGEMGRSRAGLYTLRAECYYKERDFHKAIEALNAGSKKFPDDATLLKQKFYYFADLKLYQAAIQSAMIYMQKVGASPKEYSSLAQMLIAANEIDSAIVLLEEAKLLYSKDANISVLLAHLYLKKDMKNSTAQLFEEASYYDKTHLKDAVEMHRRAGNNLHALYLNTQNIDKVEKLKQKIAIYLNAGEYRKIIGLKKALERYKMLDDDNLRYALAYSFYMADDFINAEKQLKFISDSELFSKATVIRKNIQKCSNDTLECL